MAEEEKFRVTFDVEKANPEVYIEFIKKMRRLLAGEENLNNIPNLPLLPLQEGNNPTQFFDIIFETSIRSVTVRFRRDNIYAVGYQMENGQWLEFGNANSTPPPPRLIPGSSFLGFGITYGNLTRLPLGRQPLISAVYELSTTADSSIRQRSLTVIIQMFCEAIRFPEIAYLMEAYFYVGTTPTARMIDLEHMWGDLSLAVLTHNAVNRAFEMPFNRLSIPDSTEAILLLGIVLHSCRNPRRMDMNDDDDDDDGECSGGRPLVEVFSVQILNIDGEKPGDLYGTIQVSDGLSTQYIFNRERTNIQSIRPGEFALLTGPARSMSPYGNFTIDLDLMDRDKDASPDDEVSKGNILWEVYSTTNEYDAIMYRDVPGKYGSAQVRYIVLSDAVQATVEVYLINGDGEKPAEVYGLLSANNSKFPNESVLFYKTSSEYLSIMPGNLIPLSRSVIAVPLDSTLTIRADVWEYDPGRDDEIANGKADFPAKLSGTDENAITGKYGEIKVKVTWT